jgi:hypothetical protein
MLLFAVPLAAKMALLFFGEFPAIAGLVVDPLVFS